MPQHCFCCFGFHNSLFLAFEHAANIVSNCKPCRGAKNKEALNKVLKSYIMLRRLKKDVLGQIPALQRSRIAVLPDAKNLKVG